MGSKIALGRGGGVNYYMETFQDKNSKKKKKKEVNKRDPPCAAWAGSLITYLLPLNTKLNKITGP